MENSKTYIGEVKDAIKSLLTGMGVTWKEYFTKKVTEQYPENRKTTLHVSQRHRGRLVMPHDADGNNKCVACTLCEKACPNGTIKITTEMETDEEGKNAVSLITSMIWVIVCSVSCVYRHVLMMRLYLPTILRILHSAAIHWCCILTRKKHIIRRYPIL